MQRKLFFFLTFLVILSISSKEPSNVLDVATIQDEVKTNLLTLNKSIFQLIFSYLSLLDCELRVKYMCKHIYHSYNEPLEKEKLILLPFLKNKKLFEENVSLLRNYFDFFEPRIWIFPLHFELVNVDSFSKELILLPNSIRQMIQVKVNGASYKFILFKNHKLSILKKSPNEHNFMIISLQENFEQLHINEGTNPSDIFENIRCMEVYKDPFEEDEVVEWITMYKPNNLRQNFFFNRNPNKIEVDCPFPNYPRTFLKNNSGCLEETGTGFYGLWKHVKQPNGTYRDECVLGYKENVKEIRSADYEDFAENIKVIYNDEN